MIGSLQGGQGAGLGDVFLGARGRLFGEPDDAFAVGLQLTVSFPVASAANDAQLYTGESGATIHPVLLLELRAIDELAITANLGARLRSSAPTRVATLNASHELTWGIGATIEAVEDLLRIYLEGWGSTTLENIGQDGGRESTHFEALGGIRLEPVQGLEVGLAGGAGLVRGFGTPDFRGVFTVGYAMRPIREAESGPSVGDRDGDGLLDDVDQCPDEPEDLDGFEDENGCPDPDNDQDGILDEPDECPLQPEDIHGFEDENGCPDPDNDQDTVLDEPDRCPNVPGPPDNDGCPPEAEIEESRIIILRRVEFETDSEILAEASHTVLDAVRQVLEENPQLRRIRIEGHTDDRDTERHNMDLSRRRARSVGRWLVEHGIARRRLRAFGCGEAHPLQSNGTEEGMQANRRVEFHIVIPAPASVSTLPGCRRLSL